LGDGVTLSARFLLVVHGTAHERGLCQNGRYALQLVISLLSSFHKEMEAYVRPSVAPSAKYVRIIWLQIFMKLHMSIMPLKDYLFHRF